MEPAVLNSLRDRYARKLGELKECEVQGERIKADLVHLEAVIRMYRADWTGEDVAPRRPGRRLMKVGKGIQTALDVIREASRPLTVREISAEVMRRLEIPLTAEALRSIDSSLRYTLAKHEGQGIVAEGVSPKRYRIVL